MVWYAGAIDVKWVDVMLDDEQCLLMIEDISDTEVRRPQYD